MTLSCPAKTFFIGEYLALEGGPSILVSTGPRFELRVLPRERSGGSSASAGTEKANVTDLPHPFHPESPAGLLYARHASELSGHQFLFIDPYAGLGGLGASSAQFILLYAFLKKWTTRESWTTAAHLNHDGVLTASTHRPSHALEPVSGHTPVSVPTQGQGRETPAAHGPMDWRQILADYRACAWDGRGRAPSGADIISQIVGQITVFDGTLYQAREYAWPFADLDFTLIRTGVKLATHEHLRDKTEALPVEKMRIFVQHANEAMKEALVLQDAHAEEAFCAAVRSFAEVLQEAGLVAEATLSLLQNVVKIEGVRAAKGCGAMGADILLVLHTRAAKGAVTAWANEATSLKMAACGDDLSHGLWIE